MKKTLNQFLTEKVEDYEDKFKDTDCDCEDLSKEEKEYCNNKRLLKLLTDFRIRNN